MEDEDGLRFSELEEYSDSDLSDDDEVDAFREANTSTGSAGSKVPGLKHINEMKNIFGLDDVKAKQIKRKERKLRAKAKKKAGKMTSDGQKIIQTLASKMKSRSAPELVVFNDPRKRKRDTAESRQSAEVKSTSDLMGKKRKRDEPQEVNMKQARFDVFKFSLSGLNKEEKTEAEVAQLISLGAKPPKNKCYDYNEYKAMKKKEKEEMMKARQARRLNPGLLKKSSLGARKKKAALDVDKSKKKKKQKESIQSKVGKFDGGMLKLSSKEISKIKGSK